MKRILILGCGGFIGSHLLDRLLSMGTTAIEGWDPNSQKIAGHLANPLLDFRNTTIDGVNSSTELSRAVSEADVVINLAAICNPAEYNTRPLDVIRANLFDIYPIVQLCASYRKWLISFSTSEVYGRTIASYLPNNTYGDLPLYELFEDHTPLIMGPIESQRWTYACAKQMMERLIYATFKETGMPFTIVRPLNFFGPRMDYIPGRDGEGLPRVLACFMSALFDGSPMRLVDGGNARRTILSIHEAIDAIVLMLENPERAQNQIFNIGNRANEVTIAELAHIMREIYASITGNSSFNNHPIESVTAREFYGEGYEDCDRRLPNLDKARDLLGWSPKISLRDILIETMSYYHRQYKSEKLGYIGEPE